MSKEHRINTPKGGFNERKNGGQNYLLFIASPFKIEPTHGFKVGDLLVFYECDFELHNGVFMAVYTGRKIKRKIVGVFNENLMGNLTVEIVCFKKPFLWSR